MEKTRSMECSDCGERLDEHAHGTSESVPCPNCRSVRKTISLCFVDDAQLDLKDSLRGKIKDSTKPSKKKLRQDFFVGDDMHQKSGKWYKKERYLNKDENTYKEVVTDPETGKIVHCCEEPLDQHQGHGSAKKKPDEMASPVENEPRDSGVDEA